MALSEVQRLQGEAPSHYVATLSLEANHGNFQNLGTLDFFSRQRSQALQTRLRVLESESD